MPIPGNQNKRPGDMQNILQGDDSLPTLNSSLNNPPSGATMDAHNMGDHDASGRFNPFGGLPDIHANQPGDPSFVRQLGPIRGGKHVDDEEGSYHPINPDTIQHAAPTLGTKRQDEPDQNQIGLDPSQGKMKID
jgi:hypothetical protein